MDQDQVRAWLIEEDAILLGKGKWEKFILLIAIFYFLFFYFFITMCSGVHYYALL
jgi:hypothetical protein